MEFSATEDIDAPMERVFELLSDFDHYERQAIRRGIDVRRISAASSGPLGRAWDARFDLRGRPRELRLDLVREETPQGLTFAAVSNGISASMEIDLIALSSRRTRMTAVLKVEPRTFSARLMLQPVRLGQRKMTRRYRQRVGEFAKLLDGRA